MLWCSVLVGWSGMPSIDLCIGLMKEAECSKILIANRGEIACRIIKTARRMGIATVVVYSDADARAPFVQMADEAVHIGSSPAAQSYLVTKKIIAACKALEAAE